METHTGGCHCGAVRFEVESDFAETVTCNCSHCSKKGFILSFVPADVFKITQGEDSLTSYRFNKHVIDHLFCKLCGTEAFAKGLEDPQVGINVRCIDDIDLEALKPSHMNGKDW